ncbi:MAG: hypothetical protein JWP01_740 [Myxococcales bacterium]|nr:hypothetical protein [Myxococcales bacterium]
MKLTLTTLVMLAGCGFSITSGGGGDDSVPEGRQVTIVDDTATDFAANQGLTDGAIAPRGVIEPAAFVIGGLRARAFDGNLVTDASTYDTVVAAVGPELGFGYRQVPRDWSADSVPRPRGLGLTSSSTFTLLYTGEIALPQGMVTLEALADDRVVAQVALDGTTFGERLFAHNASATITLNVPAAGWYPIRAAYGQAGGVQKLSFAITPSGMARVAVDGDRLRARVTEDRGLVASAFDGKGLLAAAQESAVRTIDEDYAFGAPAHDVGVSTVDRYSMRFAGQLKIDEPGMYTFTADIGTEAGDLYRIWIDDKLVAQRWPPTPDVPMVTLALEPGWHDLLVDFGEEDLSAKIQLVMSGPGIPSGPIDPQRLRPAVAFGLTAPYVALTTYPLADATSTAPGVTQVNMPLVAPAGAKIAAVDYGFAIANQRLSDLTVDLLDCHGAMTVSPLAAGVPYYYYAADPSCAGMPVMPAAPWAWRVTDSVPGNGIGLGTPVIALPVLVATYSGGDRRPFATAITFMSKPHPTPGAISYAPIKVTADLRGASINVEIRAAADAASLAQATWVPAPADAPPSLAAGDVVQYRFSILTNGWQFPTVDKVEVTYVVSDE